MGVPQSPVALCRPDIAAHVLDFEYEYCTSLGSGTAGFEAAGILDRERGIISISTRFNERVQRFTGAHEIGHLMLHEKVAAMRLHRDRPIFDLIAKGRPPLESEADYFAACFLAPEKQVIAEFEKRFGPAPLRLDEDLAWHLCGESYTDLFIAPSGSLLFPAAVAGAQKLDGRRFPSLANYFGLSVNAMAIRLLELQLVRD